MVAPWCSWCVLLAGALASTEEAKDAREPALGGPLLEAGQVVGSGPTWAHVALVISNFERLSKKEHNITVEFSVVGILQDGKVVRNDTKICNYFKQLMSSLLLHSTGTPVHLVVLTEQESLAAIRRHLAMHIGRHLSETIIRPQPMGVSSFAHIFPRIRTDFVSLSSIVAPHREEIDKMKQHFGHHMPVDTKFVNDAGVTIVPTFKYTLDLFYILPFYHLAFPALPRLLVLDLDLKLHCDLRHVWDHFKNFSPTQVMGVAADQSPHYFSLSREHRAARPGSTIGAPGGLSQGVNTGVALYDLEKMRASPEYREQATAEAQEALAIEYKMGGTVGDQDWVTLLGWARPHLVYLLPCQFNVQTDQVYNTVEWRDVWDSYHSCPNSTLILHHNGE